MKVFSEESALQLSEMLLQNDKDIKTEIEGKIPSVEGLASEKYVDNAVKNAKPDLDGYATETFVNNAIANAQLGGGDTEIDLSGYATKDDLKGYAAKEHAHDEYLTEHQDLSAYALKSEIPTDYIKSIPDEYVTEGEMNVAIAQAQLSGGDVNLSNYYTRDEVDNLIPNDTDITDIVNTYMAENPVNTDIIIGNGLEIKYGNEINANNSIDNMTVTNIDGNQYNLQVSSDGKVTALKSLPFKKTIYDIKPIPDLHNTGCDGELTNYLDIGIWTEASSSSLLYINKSIIEKHHSNIFENIDFDGVCLYFNQTEEQYGYSQIIFRNCRVNGLLSDGSTTTYCVQSLNSSIELIFENCTFINARAAVNNVQRMTFKNCYANGFQGDCFKLGSNIKIINCYAAQAGLGEGAHADGVQFSGGSKFYVDNYRCDAIAIKDVNVYNAGFYIDFESGDIKELESGVVENIYVNGGGYTIYLISEDGYTLQNIKMRNAQYGCSYQFDGFISSYRDEFAKNGRCVAASTAYVTSVWKEDGVIKFCVTNYTNAERTLIISTSKGNSTITVPACPTYDEYYETYTSVDQFPFNLEYEVADAEWFVAYDTSISEENQIRFVDFRFNDTQDTLDLSDYYTKEEVNTAITNAQLSGGGVSEEQISKAVDTYMAENPINDDRYIPTVNGTTLVFNIITDGNEVSY